MVSYFYAQRFAKGFGKYYFTGREATFTAKLGSQFLVLWDMWVGLLRCWDCEYTGADFCVDRASFWECA